MDDQTTISQEGFQTLEDVVTAASEELRPDGNSQLTLVNLKELTVTKAYSAAKLREQIRAAREMVSDSFSNNPAYRAAHEVIKAEQKDAAIIKQQIRREPSVMSAEQKLKDLRAELKEKSAEISDYALQILRTTNNTEFEKDGETFEIVPVAKLIRKM